MTRKTKQTAAETPAIQDSLPPPPRLSRTMTLITLMQAPEGANIKALCAAVGWQAHSIRGFISGTLKRRSDLEVVTVKTQSGRRYHVRARAEGEA